MTGHEAAVEIVGSPPTPTAVIRAVSTWPEFPRLWRQLLDEVYRARAAGAFEQRGDNVMVYLDDRPSVEIGVQAAASFDPYGSVVASTLPTGPAAHLLHRGAYARLGESHAALLDWCRARGRSTTGVRWEIYGDWRENEAELETDIFWQLG